MPVGGSVGRWRCVGVEVLVANGLFAVEEEQAVVVDELVDAVVVVYCPTVARRGAEQVDAVGEIGVGIVEDAEEGGHDVGLLSHHVADTARQGGGGVEDDDGDAVGSERGGIFGSFGVVGVVGGDDENGVLIPGHLAGSVEEVL